MTKPTVYYHKLISCYLGLPAKVVALNHPSELVINGAPTRTSRVIRYDEKTGVFETRNTLYRPQPQQNILGSMALQMERAAGLPK